MRSTERTFPMRDRTGPFTIICVYMWGQEQVKLRTYMWKPHAIQALPLTFLSQGLSLNLELTDLARPASWLTPRVCLLARPWCCGYSMLHHVAFLRGDPGACTRVLGHPLLAELSPPCPLRHCYFLFYFKVWVLLLEVLSGNPETTVWAPSRRKMT